MNGHVDRQRRLEQFRRIDIDHDLLRVGSKACIVVADLADIEAATQNEQKITTLDGEIA